MDKNTDRKLCLSRSNKIIAGVCGGIAEYFKVDVSLIRIVWVVAMLTTFFAPIAILYVIFWAIMPLPQD